MILIDAGPLVALMDTGDQHHSACVAAFREIREPLATVWPPLTEALYLLNTSRAAQSALLEVLERGAIEILPLDSSDFPRIRELMQKYSNRQMDVADAALIRVAEREGVRKIFTTDRKDFSVYRLHDRARIAILP